MEISSDQVQNGGFVDPTNGLEFKWENVDGAESYLLVLQIEEAFEFDGVNAVSASVDPEMPKTFMFQADSGGRLIKGPEYQERLEGSTYIATLFEGTDESMIQIAVASVIVEVYALDENLNDLRGDIPEEEADLTFYQERVAGHVIAKGTFKLKLPLLVSQ